MKKNLFLILVLFSFVIFSCDNTGVNKEKVDEDSNTESNVEKDMAFTVDELLNVEFFGSDSPESDEWTVVFYEDYGVYGWPDLKVRFDYVNAGDNDQIKLSDLISSEELNTIEINVVDELGYENLLIISRNSEYDESSENSYPYSFLWGERSGYGRVVGK